MEIASESLKNFLKNMTDVDENLGKFLYSVAIPSPWLYK